MRFSYKSTSTENSSKTHQGGLIGEHKNIISNKTNYAKRWTESIVKKKKADPVHDTLTLSGESQRTKANKESTITKT